jgi:hypothetical protein
LRLEDFLGPVTRLKDRNKKSPLSRPQACYCPPDRSRLKDFLRPVTRVKEKKDTSHLSLDNRRATVQIKGESEVFSLSTTSVSLSVGPACGAPFTLHLGPVTRIREKKNKSPLSRLQAVVCCAVSKGCTGHACRVG